MATTHFISHIDHDELQDMTLIGTGSSAKVYRAAWRGTYVVVKQLHYQIDLCMEEMVTELANEIKLWSQLMASIHCPIPGRNKGVVACDGIHGARPTQNIHQSTETPNENEARANPALSTRT